MAFRTSERDNDLKRSRSSQASRRHTAISSSYIVKVKKAQFSYIKQVFPIFLKPGGGPVAPLLL